MKNLLVLDLGSKTGYAAMINGAFESGSVHFKKDKMFQFFNWLSDFVVANAVEIIVFEDVKAHKGTAAAHAYGGYKAIVDIVKNQSKTIVYPIGVGEWKKISIGKGNADKNDILDKCKLMGYEPKTQDEADAIMIYEAVKDKI